MNTFFKMMLLSVVLFGVTACSGDDDEAKDITLEVSYANLNGTWRLSNWNGEEINEDQSYVYIEFSRKEHTYTMYEKMSTGKAWKRTGSFNIEQDEKYGDVISGSYDYGAGNWNQKYVITDLTNDSMIWTVIEDASDVSIYTRCNGIPADIKAGTRNL